MKVDEASGRTPLWVNASTRLITEERMQDREEPASSMIREQLARILQSPIFSQSNRLNRFLRFVVESALSGESSALKEYVIGTEVYDRKPPYHPTQDSIVRTEARRLRSKLKEYYESEGGADPLFIYFRTGSYVPVFRTREGLTADNPTGNRVAVAARIEASGVCVAVIPFIDVSGDPVSAECALGITEELNHDLMRTGGCGVVTVGLIAQLAPATHEITSLAQKLGVQLFFEGTVRKERHKLRITARLANADGFQLWSQQFEAEPGRHGLFTITAQIASALISRTRPQDWKMRESGASSQSTYSALLSAEALMDEGASVDSKIALLRFQELIGTSPENAGAYCGMAQCNYELAISGNADSVNALFQARSATLRALALDPQVIIAHSCLGSVLALERNWTAAEKCFEHALSLGSDPVTHRHFALFLTAMGRFEEALHYLRRAQATDPFSNRQKLASIKILYFSRQYDKVLDWFAAQHTYGALPLEVKIYLAFAYLRLGRLDEAVELANGIRRESFKLPWLMASVAEVMVYCGNAEEAGQIADNFRLLSANSPISRFRQASLSIALGDFPNAMSTLEAACEAQEPELLWLAVDPRFDPIRQDTQFSRIKRKANLGAIEGGGS